MKTGIIGKALENDGAATAVKIRSFNGGHKCVGFRVCAFTRTPGSLTFQADGAGIELAEWTSVQKGERTIKLAAPLRFKKGQYLGLTSTKTTLNLCTISYVQVYLSRLMPPERAEAFSLDIYLHTHLSFYWPTSKTSIVEEEKAERETTKVFWGDGYSPSEKKGMKEWEGVLALGFTWL